VTVVDAGIPMDAGGGSLAAPPDAGKAGQDATDAASLDAARDDSDAVSGLDSGIAIGVLFPGYRRT
jgi:hypothetical protein